MASSSSTDMIHRKKYDVFLSFRGEDTRDNFTSHLYASLSRKHIETFIDNQLTRGDEISESLLKAIQESYISVIIFSERYASSGWCLDELVKILECKNKYGHVVIPVFYRVDPSDVRSQTGIFGDSFSKLEERFQGRLDKLQKWRIALKEAANLSGFHSRVIRPESELIESIADEILKRMKNLFSSEDNDQLIGVDSRILEIESLLNKGSKDVCKLGIWGIGGVGKTTIATAVFNKILSYFDSSCFIQNVGEESEKVGGLAQLKWKLLSTLLKDENAKTDILNMGFNFRRLSRMKVLIVLDDVTHFQQIESLIGSLDCFGIGSRIIITTRDKHVLEVCGVHDDEIYKMNELVYHDAFKLFSRHAFGKNDPDVGYEELSCKVMKYAQGVPLALKVLGCFLFKRSEEEWVSEINKLKEIPHMDIQKVLKVSYDRLDHEQKNIFLDIACFFKGRDKDDVANFLDACGFFAKIGMSVLIDRCLISISYNNKIAMHDLLQEMGREIVRQESINNPGKRSRLWHHEDIYKTFTHNTVTEAIEGISLDMSKMKKSICLYPDTFTKMHNLRFIEFYGGNIKRVHMQDMEWSMTELRYLQWPGYPLKSLPLHPEKLGSLKMVYSKVKQLWDGVQDLVNLKEIDLRYSKQLTKLPDLSNAQNLEYLYLCGCISLVETHSSIQYLNKLAILDLKYCITLTSLPRRIRSESLEGLILVGCSNLNSFPEISSCIMEELDLNETAIEELPSSIDCLYKLEFLDFKDCSRLERLPSTLFNLASLQWLNLSGCSNLKRLPEITSSNFNLQELHLEGSAIEELPPSIDCLFRLEFLNLKDCSRFERLPSSLFNLESLQRLNLSGCSNWKRLSEITSSNFNLQELHLEGSAIEELPPSIDYLSGLQFLNLNDCSRLEKLPSSIFNLKSLQALNLSGCSNLKRLPEISCCNLEKFDLKGSAIEELPSSIDSLSRLEFLNMEDCSRLERLPSSIFNLQSLEALNLSGCSNVKRLPEISSCNLEKLDLKGSAIEELPSSIDCLSRLEFLDFKDCKRLERLPCSLFNLESLERLNLSSCSNLKSLPDISSCNLQELHLDGSAIEELPQSIDCLSALVTLHLSDCSRLESLPSSLFNLQFLEYLYISHCGITELPESLAQLSSLKKLYLDKNNFCRIPESIINLSKLERIHLSYCERLQSLPNLPCSLQYMHANHCSSLEALSGLSILFTIQNSNQIFELRNCLKLDENELKKIVDDALQKIQLAVKQYPGSEIPVWFKYKILHNICYPGSDIPEWFKYQSMGSSITLERAPGDHRFNNDFVVVAFCVIVALEEDHQSDQEFYVYCQLKVKTEDVESHLVDDFLIGTIDYVEADHVILGYKLYNNCGYGFAEEYFYNKGVSLEFYLKKINYCKRTESCVVVKKCRVRLLSAQGFGESKKDR